VSIKKTKPKVVLIMTLKLLANFSQIWHIALACQFDFVTSVPAWPKMQWTSLLDRSLWRFDLYRGVRDIRKWTAVAFRVSRMNNAYGELCISSRTVCTLHSTLSSVISWTRCVISNFTAEQQQENFIYQWIDVGRQSIIHQDQW